MTDSRLSKRRIEALEHPWPPDRPKRAEELFTAVEEHIAKIGGDIQSAVAYLLGGLTVTEQDQIVAEVKAANR